MTYVFTTTEEAEQAANEMYLVVRPEGTTERLYGWVANLDSTGFILYSMDERWRKVDNKWLLVDDKSNVSETIQIG